MLNEVFYRKCIQCGLRTESSSPVCPDCMEQQEKYDFACESCGYPANVPVKVCGKCTGRKYRDKIYITYKYRGAVKQLIRDIKFSFRMTGISSVGELIDTEMLGQYDLITDVPSHFTRKLRRRAHPAGMLAKYMADKLNCTYKTVLNRTRRTEYQYKLKKKQRASNVNGAFTCTFDVRGLKILLVDDIITTGSTIEECSRILKKSGAVKVDVYALTGGNM